MIIIPQQNQNLLDIALQYLGDAGKAYAIAELNGIEVHEDLSTVSELILPDEIVNEKLVQSYELNHTRPASEWDKEILNVSYRVTQQGKIIAGIEPKIGIRLTEDGNPRII